MIKTRIIPILLLKGSSIVKSTKFENHRMVGDAVTNVKVFSSRMADEMVIVDIEATKHGRINLPLVKRLSSQCIMPLSIGGGVVSINDADGLFRSGADKIVINSAFYADPALFKEISAKYGEQAVVFSLDVKRVDGKYRCFSDAGQTLQGGSVRDVVLRAEDVGVGEVLVNSIDNDGGMTGYDTELISLISDTVRVPVIAAGGCGTKQHCVSAIKAGASAIAAGSIFYWVGESIITLKEHLNENGIPVRLVR